MLHTRLMRSASRILFAGLLALATVGGSLVSTPTVSAHARDHDHAKQMHNVTIVAHDNGSDTSFEGSFSMPSKVPTGLVEITFTNRGSQDHMAQFFRLDSGVSEKTFLTKLATLFATQDPPKVVSALHALLDIGAAAGGAGSVTPGNSQTVIERLAAGHYVAVCFDTTSNGTPHFLLGMHKSFWVASDAWAPIDRNERIVDGVPASNGTILEFDHSISVPHVISSGRPLLLKIKVSDQTHEFQLLRVPNGTTAADLLQCFAGPPSACKLTSQPEDAGGAASIAPGSTHWIELHLKAGTYAAVCFVPDINTGMPHAFMGMITVFKVKK